MGFGLQYLQSKDAVLHHSKEISGNNYWSSIFKHKPSNIIQPNCQFTISKFQVNQWPCKVIYFPVLRHLGPRGPKGHTCLPGWKKRKTNATGGRQVSHFQNVETSQKIVVRCGENLEKSRHTTLMTETCNLLSDIWYFFQHPLSVIYIKWNRGENSENCERSKHTTLKPATSCSTTSATSDVFFGIWTAKCLNLGWHVPRAGNEAITKWCSEAQLLDLDETMTS